MNHLQKVFKYNSIFPSYVFGLFSHLVSRGKNPTIMTRIRPHMIIKELPSPSLIETSQGDLGLLDKQL